MNIKSINLAFLLAVLGLFAVAAGQSMAAAPSLDQAKSQGLVGEQYDGYLGVVSGSASAGVRSLVSEVNAKRRAEYQRIANANNIAIADVEALAGKKAIQKTAGGDYIKLQGQDWRKK